MRIVWRTVFLAACICSAVSIAGAAAIHDAVQAKNIELVRQLLAADSSNVNLADDAGMTPLHYAAQMSELETVRLLLAAGAVVDVPDTRSLSPVMLAALTNRRNVVGLLIDHGASVQQTHPMFGTLIDLAFHAECQRGWSGLTEFLTSRGLAFDPDFVGVFGSNRAHLAVIFNNERMMQYLLDRGATVDIVRANDGRTPLADAADRGRTDIVKLLLAHGADMNTLDKAGNTPLVMPIKNGHSEIVRLLLQAGARTDFVDPVHGRNLLHLAAISGHLEILRDLLDAGVDVHRLDNHDRSPLFYAGKYGHRRLAELLVNRGSGTLTKAEENFGPSPDLSPSLVDGEAVVWYLNGRGWAIKTKNHFFIIDAEEFGLVRPTEPALANGFLTPGEIGGQQVVAMYTCYHGEVGEPAYIHEIEDSLAAVVYIHNTRDPWRGSKHPVYLDPREEYREAGCEIRSISVAETNPVNGYFCRADGITFFYPGFLPEDLEQFKKEVDFLSQYVDRIDCAFLPIAEPGEENLAARYVVEKLNPRAIFPMDPDRRENLFGPMVEAVHSWGSTAMVFCAENPGDKFTYHRQ